MLVDLTPYLGPSTVRDDLARQLNELEREQLDHDQHTRERTNINHVAYRAQGKGKNPWNPSNDENRMDRKTKFGGYAHTQQTKELIGKANAGKTPVNKGKPRSSKDASAIRRGVNRTNDMLILKGLLKHDNGISYEGFNRLKKDIKKKRGAADRKHGDEKAQCKMEIEEMAELRDKIKRG